MALFESTFPPYVPFGSRTLRLTTPNLRGTDVAVLQAVYDLMLETMNPPLGPMGAPVPITGVFDPATRQAVRNIQSFFGLSPDGVAGPDLYFVYGQGVASHTTYGGPVYGSRTLSQGSSGGDVKILQNRLNCFRYAAIGGGPADGIFGTRTAAAVLAFKQDAIANGDTGLAPNSVVGDGTFDATWIYTFAGGRAIQTGRNGFDVVFLQVLLGNLGFYSGRITGYYDSATVSAVRAFQLAEGIAVDGVVGPVTFYHLGLNNAHAAPTPLGIAWPQVVPAFQSCTTEITPVSDLVDTGVGTASLVSSVAPGIEALNVMIDNVADPTIFGPQYTAYAFTLTDPSTGMEILKTKMDRITSGSNVWAGSGFGPTVDFFPKGPVRIYPITSGGTLGPLAMNGNLADCH